MKGKCNENKIRQVVTQTQKDKTIDKINGSTIYQKIGVIDGVRIVVSFSIANDEPKQAYPDSNQNI